MDHLVVVPYSLAPNATNLVSLWNCDPECASLAVASPPPPARQEYAGEILDGVLMVLGSVSSGIAANALYDLLASRLNRPGKTVTYRTAKFPDGTEVTEFIGREE